MYMYVHEITHHCLLYIHGKRKEKKGKVTHPIIAQTNKRIYYIARDTWMPCLEDWGGGLKRLANSPLCC